jgi:MFS family permease
VSLADHRPRTSVPPDPDPTSAAVDPSGHTTIFASLEVRAYRLLFFAGLLSFVSIQGQMVARGWLAKELTNSNAALGGVFMAFGVTMLLLNPIGGVVADRFSRRKIMAGTQVVLAATSLWIALAISYGFITYSQLVLASAVQAGAFAFLGPARMAWTGDLVGRALLPNAIVLGQMSMNSTRVIGPALAGMAIGIAWIGTSGVYYVATGFSLLALAQIMRIPETRAAEGRSGESAVSEYMSGLRYVARHREVKMLLVTSFVVVMVAFPFMAFLPVVADELFDVGASGYGVMNGVSAVGAVAVSLYIAKRAGGEQAFTVQLVSGLCFGVGLILLALSQTYLLALASIMFIGGAASGFQSMNNSLVLALSEFEYHGRIQSMMMLSFSGFGMAALPLGILADQIGLRQTFGAMGVVTVGAMLVYRAMRAASPEPHRPSLF